MKDEIVWLTQEHMAELFDKNRTVITKHINNIFKEGKLDKDSNVQKMHFSNSEIMKKSTRKLVDFFCLKICKIL